MIEIPETNFIVMGDWDTNSVPTGKVDIRLRPNPVAFGIGAHPTTQWMLKQIQLMELTGKSILDIGAGTGILSIAALKTGAASAHIVEPHSETFESIESNLAASSVVATCEKATSATSTATAADVVFSNIDSLEILEDVLTRGIVASSGTVLTTIAPSSLDELMSLVETTTFTVASTELFSSEWLGVELHNDS